MMRKLALGAVLVVIAGLVLALQAVPLSAHHAFAAEFDASKPIKFNKAIVTRMEWVNPHVWIHIDVALPIEASPRYRGVPICTRHLAQVSNSPNSTVSTARSV